MARGELEPTELGQERLAGLEEAPPLPRLEEPGSVGSPVRLDLPVEDRQDVAPGVLGLLRHRREHGSLERGPLREPEILEHAAGAGERASATPCLGQRVVQPGKAALPIPRDMPVGADTLHALDDAFEDGDGHVVGDVLSAVGEGEQRVPGDPTDNVVRRVTVP
ncbi:MAG: hypothetical protein DDT40_01526 [candidate division WS2 bacterium]|nr:hypothetical protein [Candidatus Psychracetigena formicireducens]